MKIRLHYLYKETDKCKEKLAMLIDYYNQDIEIVLYYNNSNGIISLREKNFTLAEFYFKQCLSIFRKMKKNDPFSINLIYEKYLKYNLGITYFYQKKYEMAISTLKPLVADLGFLPYIHYRLGISFIELYLDDFKRHNSSKLNKTYERVGFIDTNKQTYFVLNSSKVLNQNASDSLSKVKEALYYFTQLAILFDMERPKYFTEINDYISRKLRDETSAQVKFEENLNQNYKNIEELKINTYFNIIFCLITLRNYSQIETFFSKLENISLDTEARIKFLFYKLEVFIHLNKTDQCLSTIDAIMEIEKANNYMLFDSSFVSSIDSALYSNSKYKLAFYVNLVKFHLNQKHFNQAEKALSNIISLGKYNEYPAYVINIFIYYYLIKGRNDIAIRILKTRKIGSLNLST
jgi:tetratricopeptide (TPR) repeat protein